MKYWAGLHGEKDDADLQAGADGLLRLASATTSNAAAFQDGARHVQSPLRIRDTIMEAGVDDMELEEQD
jgi:hypothetical protein